MLRESCPCLFRKRYLRERNKKDTERTHWKKVFLRTVTWPTILQFPLCDKFRFFFFLLAGWARLATIDYHSVRLPFSLQPLPPYSRKISLFPRLRETLLHGALFDTRRRHSTQDLTSPGDHLSCSKRKKWREFILTHIRRYFLTTLESSRTCRLNINILASCTGYFKTNKYVSAYLKFMHEQRFHCSFAVAYDCSLPFSNEKSIFLVTIFEFYFTAKVVERRMQKPYGVEFYVYDFRPVHR